MFGNNVMRSIRFVFLAFSSVLVAAGQAVRKVPASAPVPSGPIAVIDTSGGRLQCRLFARQAPELVANFKGLATGEKDWIDAAGGTPGVPAHNRPFYDGTALFGVSDGISGGDRIGQGRGAAGPELTDGKGAAIPLDRAGLLGMRITRTGVNRSMFVILDHGDLEYAGRLAVFGLCDASSVERVAAMSHTLLAAGNRPAKPLAIYHIAIVNEGEPLPPVAAEVPADAVVPHILPETGTPLIPAPIPTGPTANIETSLGTLTCRLFKETPIATANFIGLANGTKAFRNPATKQMVTGKRFYDGLHFNRVIPDFMIEQGDLPSDSSGDSEIGFQFKNEIVPELTFDRPGRLAYANSGPGTNSSEFFVTDQMAHNLDGNYTIFGQCDDASLPVVSAIARVPRTAKNRPLTPVVVKRVILP